MNYRKLGNTGLVISELGFGCGSTGGLLIRGEKPARLQAVARAAELGINYFDTAPLYGNGVSEQNLGEALRELKLDVHVGTKVRLAADQFSHITQAVARSLEESLVRLGLQCVDLLQIHNHVEPSRKPDTLSLADEDVLGEVVQALQTLKAQGKLRHYGFTGMGATEALHRVIQSGSMETLQAPYNLINPSAGQETPRDFPYQDFSGMTDAAHDHGLGILAIRVLAAGALSGSEERHPLAQSIPPPFGSGPTYQDDMARAPSLSFLVEQRYVENLAEAATRFALGKEQVSTVLLGYSSIQQIEDSVNYASSGPLPQEALAHLQQRWDQW